MFSLNAFLVAIAGFAFLSIIVQIAAAGKSVTVTFLSSGDAQATTESIPTPEDSEPLIDSVMPKFNEVQDVPEPSSGIGVASVGAAGAIAAKRRKH